jgi:hypothetical protein
MYTCALYQSRICMGLVHVKKRCHLEVRVKKCCQLKFHSYFASHVSNTKAKTLLILNIHEAYRPCGRACII